MSVGLDDPWHEFVLAVLLHLVSEWRQCTDTTGETNTEADTKAS